MTAESEALFKVSDITFVSRKIKVRRLCERVCFINDTVEIDIRTRLRREMTKELRSEFTSPLSSLIGFERALDDVGNRAIFSAHELMGKVERFGASDRSLRGHHRVLLPVDPQLAQIEIAILMANRCFRFGALCFGHHAGRSHGDEHIPTPERRALTISAVDGHQNAFHTVGSRPTARHWISSLAGLHLVHKTRLQQSIF